MEDRFELLQVSETDKFTKTHTHDLRRHSLVIITKTG